jgi:hypothetical protein
VLILYVAINKQLCKSRENSRTTLTTGTRADRRLGEDRRWHLQDLANGLERRMVNKATIRAPVVVSRLICTPSGECAFGQEEIALA